MEFDQPKLTDLHEVRRNCWRSAARRKIFNDRAKSGNFYVGSCFNPGCRGDNRNIARRRFNFSMNQGDNSAVVVIRNCPTVQPHMNGCPHLGGGHEQPDRQRQNCRCSVKTLPQSAIHLASLVLQTVCNIANDMPPARFILELKLCNQGILFESRPRDRSFCRTTACQSNMPPRFPIKRPEAFRFEPLNQIRYYYGRM